MPMIENYGIAPDCRACGDLVLSLIHYIAVRTSAVVQCASSGVLSISRLLNIVRQFSDMMGPAFATSVLKTNVWMADDVIEKRVSEHSRSADV
jgi:hypothetical protein